MMIKRYTSAIVTVFCFCVAQLLSHSLFAAPETIQTTASKSKWGDVSKWPDPTTELVEQFMKDQTVFRITSSGLTRRDYIKLAADNVEYWATQQNEDGAIIDPYRKQEWQYSTPCFALAGIAAVEFLDRDDLLVSASKAMDWACLTLSEGRAANHHEDFFTPVLAHALPLFKKHVTPDRIVTWEKQLASFDPYKVYRAKPGHGNWNIVAASGELLLSKLGLRKDIRFVEDSYAGQGGTFRSHYGLYLEGPMAYDHFPRLWAADMMAHGYDGEYAGPLNEVLRRASLTSLFLQSPAGELPLGHRSAQHQWNEAEQCVTYEIYAARALNEGNEQLASTFKRAAHLALASIKRWQRPTGELWINKNKVEPSEFHGFEGYSGHSQYNLLPMAMLVMAHEHAAITEHLPELPVPAEVGGFVVDLKDLHKVIANASGAYLEIETNADFHYDVTGLMRIHFKDENPQIGPSDVLTTKTSYTLPKVDRVAAAVGPAWQTADGVWCNLAGLDKSRISKVTVSNVTANPERVVFSITYEGRFDGPGKIRQDYTILPRKIDIETHLEGYHGVARMEWPVLASNGIDPTQIETGEKTVSVGLSGSTQQFTAPNSTSLSVSEKKYPNRNGWARLAWAEYHTGGAMTLTINPVDQ